MKTEVINSHNIDLAASLLQSGEVVAIPTETVYGLAADASNEDAIDKIFIAKGRPKNHPLIVHISEYAHISKWAKNIPDAAKVLAKHFWPGALTLILEKKPGVSSSITGSLETIAVRIPNHEFTLELIKKVGYGLVAPSANQYKSISPTCAKHVLKTLSGKISGVVDHDISQVGIESTILDLTQETPRILRAGVITKGMISKVLNTYVAEPETHSVSVSGNVKDHYQPSKPLYLKSKNEISNIIKDEINSTILHYSDFSHDLLSEYPKNTYEKMPKDYKEYAAILYSKLHEADLNNTNRIIVERPPIDSSWNCIHDRLMKASKK